MKFPLILAAVLLAGCSAPATPTTPTPTSSTAPTATSASPSATPTQPAEAMHLGDVLNLSGGDVTIQVQKAEKWSSRDRPTAFRVMVRTCNATVKDGITISWSPWALAAADGSEYPASDVTMTDDPKPQYPFDGSRAYKVGQCARGWIMFDLSKGAKVAVVRYANEGGDVAEWAASA